MKARVKATGEIIYLTYDDTLYLDISQEELEEIEIIDDMPDYWTRLEHQYAGMAMQGILSNEAMQKELMRVFGKEECIEDIIVDYAKDMALLLVRKMKEERK